MFLLRGPCTIPSFCTMKRKTAQKKEDLNNQDSIKDYKKGEMAKQKRVDWFLEFLKWGSLVLAVLFFWWLANQLGWI